MEKRIIAIAGVFVFLFVIALLIFLTTNTRPEKSNIAVYYSPPPPIVRPSPTIPPEEENALSTNSENGQSVKSSTEEIAAMHIQPDAATNLLLIQDAMGDSIASGIVSLGTEPFPFNNGIVLIPSNLTGEIPVTASADGFFPVRSTVNFATSTQQTVVMEYQCNFEIRVFENDEITPCPDATVRLWKVKTPPRPVLTEFPGTFTVHGKPESFCLKDKQCVAHRTVSSNIGLCPMNPDGSVSLLKHGDRLVLLGDRSWIPGVSPEYPLHFSRSWNIYRQSNTPSKLRIWDSLILGSSPESNLRNGWSGSELCEIEREGKRYRYSIFFPLQTNAPEIMTEMHTDSEGICHFSNLPPALYSVQSIKDKQRSKIVSLHPCCSGIKLFLSGTSKVKIIVIRKNAERYPLAEYAYSSESRVSMKSTDGQGGIYTGSISGITFFEKVPYGSYHVSVSLSPKFFHQTKIEKDIVIDEPLEFVNITVDDWKGYAVSGTVFDMDTGEPVKGYPLSLQTAYGVGMQDKRITNKEGYFIFHDAAPNSYNLFFKPSDKNKFEYIPILENYPAGPFIPRSDDYFFGHNFGRLSVKVVDRDVSGIKIPVKRIEETRFSGKVTYPDGTPATGAVLRVMVSNSDVVIETLDAYTLPNKPETNEEGLFEFSIIKNSSLDFSSCAFEITAEVGEVIPAYWEEMMFEDGGKGYSLNKEQFVPTKVGTLSLQGKSGDTFSGLHIVLEFETGHTVYGRFITDETDFQPIEVKATQYSKNLLVQSRNDGTFSIENVAGGPFLLKIYPRNKTAVNTPYGIQSRFKYLFEKIDLVMPDDRDDMYVDIELRPRGYIWGTVMDSQGNPARNTVLYARDYTGTAYIGQAYVNDQGFFIFGNSALSEGEKYSLHCYGIQNKQKIHTVHNVKPSIEDMKITLP